ncbi:hypothetical protein DFH09DRAFT_1270599 [Mycena vulgaris]|nr:hypothetical protein DFH09DRAFT_1270599 [Mycena vulgaris]
MLEFARVAELSATSVTPEIWEFLQVTFKSVQYLFLIVHRDRSPKHIPLFYGTSSVVRFSKFELELQLPSESSPRRTCSDAYESHISDADGMQRSGATEFSHVPPHQLLSIRVLPHYPALTHVHPEYRPNSCSASTLLQIPDVGPKFGLERVERPSRFAQELEPDCNSLCPHHGPAWLCPNTVVCFNLDFKYRRKKFCTPWTIYKRQQLSKLAKISFPPALKDPRLKFTRSSYDLNI